MKAANENAERTRLVRVIGEVSADGFERLEVPELVRVEVKWLGGKRCGPDVTLASRLRAFLPAGLR